MTPPYRIETDRLVIRCWEPRDAAPLADAVGSSIDHLRAWMPWAEGEPISLDDRVELLRTFRGNFDLGEDFVYGIFERDESRVLGGSGLHRRLGDGAFEIGYWLRAGATGKGLATEATAAITRAGFEHGGVDRIEIHVDPANERSCLVPPRLGFAEEATLRRRLPVKAGSELRDMVVFTMFAADLGDSPAAQVAYAAFDAAGRPLPADARR